MIELVGDELYQWDMGRKVKITPKRGYTISCVHFNDGSDSPLTMVNGIAMAKIPDKLLEQCGSVTVYAVHTGEKLIETTESRQFYIKKKTKPTGYTHVQEEVAAVNSAISAKNIMVGEHGTPDNPDVGSALFNAKTYATNASNSAKNASTSANSANAYATNASNSAKNALTSETNAKTYATNASNSAKNASTSANSANAYKVAAENAKNEILGNGGTYSDPKDKSALKEIRDSREAIKTIESNMSTAVEAAGQIDSFRSEITKSHDETINARDEILGSGDDTSYIKPADNSALKEIRDAKKIIVGDSETASAKNPDEESALKKAQEAQAAAAQSAKEAKEAATSANQGIKVVDALDNTSTSNALSANQGKVLNEKIANLNEIYIMKSGETEADVPKSVEVIIMPEESGTPYVLTDSDKSEIASLVKAEVPLVKSAEQPIFANSIDECTDTTKLYVLPDGQIYAYMMYEGINYSYDNLLTSDKWLPEKRVSSTGEIKTNGAEGMVAVGDIPCKAGDLVRIKNFDLTINVNGRLAFVDSNDSAILTLYTAQNYDGSNIGFFKDQISETDGVQSFVVGVDGTGTQISKASAITAIRFSQVSTRVGNMEDVIVTVNQEITEPTVVKEYRWSDTGHAFVSANYEDRIVELEESVSGLQRDISEIRENINNLEAVSVPSYYDDIIDNKTNEVKSLQSTCGNNCVSFVWASDTHIPDNSGGRTNDIGKVMAKILNNCQIPFAVISGDVGTQASHTTEDALLESQKSIPEHLAPLWGTDRLLVSLGNHDGAWGDSSGYYRHQLTPQRMFQLYFSGQALDFRRVFSDDGLYFYVDDVSHKARYIVLNSQFAGEYAEDSNGWAVNNRFGTSCYGQSQLEWFANVALDMPGGYGAIVVTHVPLNIDYTVDRSQLIGIINAHCNKTTFHGEITDGVDGWSNSTIDVNYQNATGEIIAVFTGHIHKDTIDTTTLACPMISITTAGGDVRDTDAPVRTPGTDSETAFDIVTINRTTKRINCTRVGAGQSREIEYTSYASSQEPNSTEVVPDYWMEELEEKADAIQQAMEAAGRNKSAFLWYTDSHWVNGNSKISPKLLNYLYMNTPMNKVNFGGDIIGDSLLATRDEMKYLYEWRKAIRNLPNHHSVFGNHDMYDSSSVEYENDNYRYAFLLAPEETADMVCGDGNYYYIDNRSEKTRYLHLAYLSSDLTAMLTQGEFICDSIKSVPEGWHIVAIAHRWWQYSSLSNPTVGVIPAYETEILQIFDEYNARKSHSASNYFTSQNFADAKGKVEFCIGGHLHVDYDFKSDGGIPVIITAPDTNQDRVPDSTVDCGTIGTITESAVFGIIADYNEDITKITVVGVGRGTSRVVRASTVVPISISDISYSGNTTVGSAIDKSKFSFTVNYSDDTTSSVTGANTVTPEIIGSVGNNSVTITYEENGTTLTGTVTIVGTEKPLVNLFDKDDADVLLTGRFNSSRNAVEYKEGQLCTGYIEAKPGDVFALTSDKSNKTNGYTGVVQMYDSSKTCIGGYSNETVNWTWSSDYLTGSVEVDSTLSNTAYVRFCVAYTDINSIIITKS